MVRTMVRERAGICRLLIATSVVGFGLISPVIADDETPEPSRPLAPAVEDNEPRWLDSLARGYTQAQRRQKPIFVKVSSATCRFCRELAEQLEKPALQEELKRWTLVAIDVDKSPNDARLLAVGPVPALRALASSGRVVAAAEGAQIAQELLNWLKESFEQAASILPDELDTEEAPDVAAVGRLIQSFRNRDAVIREAVIRKLLPHPELAAAPIVEAFADGSLSTRLAALDLLVEWKAPVEGLDPWRKETLTEARLKVLTEWGATVHTLPAAESSELGPTDLAAAHEMIDHMLTAPVGDAQAIRERLARYGNRLLPEVYERLKTAATDEIRERLTILRYRLVESQALALRWPGGIERLAAPEPETRHRAADELAARATPADEPLLLELFSDPAPLVREISLRALRQAGGTNVNSALLRLLDDPEPNVRAAVLKHLAEDASPAAVTRIAKYVQEESDSDLVVHAVRVLREQAAKNQSGNRTPADGPTKTARAALLSLLEHASWRVRAEAAESLGKVIPRYGNASGPDIAEIYLAMVDLLKDEDGFVVSRAVGTLVHADLVAAVDPLVAAAEAHPELAIEVVKALAYGTKQREKADAHLRRFADHTDPRLRAAAIVGLAQSGPAIADDMRKALTDDNSDVRIAAGNALFGVLENRRRSADENVRLGIYKDAADVPDSNEEGVPQAGGGRAGPLSAPVIETDDDDEAEPAESSPTPASKPAPAPSRPAANPIGDAIKSIFGSKKSVPPTRATPDVPNDSGANSPDESSFTGRDRADEWLRVVRSGTVIPKSLHKLRDVLEPMLKAESTEERVAALLPLTALGADELVVDDMLRIVAAEPGQIARLSEGLPWLLAADRGRVVEKMLSATASRDDLVVIASNLAEIHSPQAEQTLWQLVSHELADLTTAQTVKSSLMQAYFPKHHYQLEQAPKHDRKRATTAATSRAKSGGHQQRLVALSMLLELESDTAIEIAKTMFDNPATPLAERTEALQILLLTLPEPEAIALAVKQFVTPHVPFHEKAMARLVDDSSALQSLGDGEFYLEGNQRSHSRQMMQQSGTAIAPEAPAGLTFEPLEPLLKSDNPRIAAHAGYLAALLGHPEGLPPLLAYWRGRGADDVDWMRLVYRAITGLNDGTQTPVLREIYSRLGKENYRHYLGEFYWTIRSMTAQEVLPLRKAIRDEVGLENLR